MANAQQRNVYPGLTLTQQRRVRDSVFDDLATAQIRLTGPLQQITAIMDEVSNLAAFVTANSTDFTADGTIGDLTAARNNVRDVIVDAIDAIAGISSTRP